MLLEGLPLFDGLVEVREAVVSGLGLPLGMIARCPGFMLVPGDTYGDLC